MQGWIKLHRKLLDNPIFNDPHLLKLWVYCLLKATHKERKQIVGKQMVELQPGQFVTGRFILAEEYNKGAKPKDIVSDRTLWRWLKFLEECEFLSIKSTTKYSVVTINNWDKYQENDQQTSSKRPANDQQMSTNKNVKNIEDEEETNPVALYERNFFPLTPMQIESIWDWVDDFKGNQEVICMAIKETALKNPSSPFKYLTRILVDWHKRKLFTLEDVLKAKEQYEKSKVIHLERKKQKQEQPQGRYIPKDAVVDINAGEDPNWTWKKPF